MSAMRGHARSIGLAGASSGRARSGARVPGILFALAVASFAAVPGLAHASPSLSNWVFLPGDANITGAAGDQWSPAIARGDSLLLAVWTEGRATGSAPDVFAVRLDAGGNLIDSVPIAITQDAASQTNACVAWNGQAWLVVWASQVPSQSFYSIQIAAARVSPQGQVLDAAPIAVKTFSYTTSAFFCVASDGTNWVVVWEGTAPGESDVRATRISPLGTVIDPGGVLLYAAGSSLRSGLQIAFGGSQYLLVWDEWRGSSQDVLAARMTTGLAVVDAVPIAVAADSIMMEASARVGANGPDFLVVWESYDRIALAGQVFGTRMDAQGQVLDPGGQAISGDVGPTLGREPSVAWGGTDWLVAWKTPGVSVASVSVGGGVLNPGGVQIDGGSSATKREPRIAPAPGGGAHVLWTDLRSGGTEPDDIYAAPVSAGGEPGSSRCISLGAPRQRSPRFATDGTAFMAVYLSDTSNERRLLAQPLDPTGSALTTEPTVVAAGTGLGSASIASNGTYYLAVWGDAATDTVYCRRLLPDGTLVDGAPIAVMSGESPDVAALGDVFLVAAVEDPIFYQFRYPYSRRVRATDGALLDPAPVSLGRNYAITPRVTALGNRWLVVWERRPTFDDTRSSINATFVNSDGTPVVEFAVQEDWLKVKTYCAPAVAASGSAALVVWRDPRLGSGQWNLYGRRILADGGLLDEVGFPICTAAGRQDFPEVAWDGKEFVVAWEDPRAATFLYDVRTDVYAARVTAAAQVLDPNGFAVADSAVPERQPAVVSSERGKVLIASSVFRDESPFGAFRVGFRTMSTLSFTPGLEAGEATPVAAPETAPALVDLRAAPNPSRGETELGFALGRPGRATVVVYDVTGREVSRLFEGRLAAGPARVVWNGRDGSGRMVGPGLYFARVRTDAGPALSTKILRR